MNDLTHYVELRATADADDEGGTEVFIRAMFSALHLARVKLEAPFPIDFPEAVEEGPSTGDVIRVFGQYDKIQELISFTSVQNLIARDIFSGSGTLEVPANCGFVYVKRMRPTATPSAVNKKIAHLKNHFAKKGFKWTAEYEKERRKHFSEGRKKRYPYVKVVSNTTENAFSVMFQRNNIESVPEIAAFDNYGLGKNESAVPSF